MYTPVYKKSALHRHSKDTLLPLRQGKGILSKACKFAKVASLEQRQKSHGACLSMMCHLTSLWMNSKTVIHTHTCIYIYNNKRLQHYDLVVIRIPQDLAPTDNRSNPTNTATCCCAPSQRHRGQGRHTWPLLLFPRDDLCAWSVLPPYVVGFICIPATLGSIC